MKIYICSSKLHAMENQYMENSVDPFLKNTPLFRVNFFESATLLFLSEKIESLKMQLLRRKRIRTFFPYIESTKVAKK